MTSPELTPRKVELSTEPDHRCHNHLACAECGEEFDWDAPRRAGERMSDRERAEALFEELQREARFRLIEAIITAFEQARDEERA